ncbi:High affinity cAMP-specific 3' 5'-cyclic phosphodiesterase 7A [Fasciola gigantica]|uniref:High affinity cAMP-specific 3' 5'-cyclic phosphodiesterase 7A n=1 Tax=Fasciola gigantica TaxID=46835 RepID=A0A504YKG1_FASGI|nr:High affinity cAMP-specific 3' 5'-cyclic phosphodiesterase 7A [Fasciola gigantica]
MRSSLVDDDQIGGRPKSKTDGKRCSRTMTQSKRSVIRSNSIGAFSCNREACTSATSGLSFIHRSTVDEIHPPVLDQLVNSPEFRIRFPSLQSTSSLLSPQSIEYQSPLVDLPTKLIRIHGVDKWTFDIFSFKRRSSSQLVCSIGLHLFERHDLMRKLRLDYLTVLETLGAIESVYWQHNPYHTALHAADVTQATHCFISQSKLYQLLSPAEILGTLLAALCHDADHPGMNQLHLERTGNFLVTLYAADSVLEKHHARVGLTILHRSGLAQSLDKSAWTVVRDCMIKLIEATDMAYQGLYKAKFLNLVDSKKKSHHCIYTPSERILLLQMSLKCADISNPCRPWQLCRQWAQRICSEFFCQGDQERSRWALAPAKSFDRTISSIPEIQVGFIEHLVKPLFSTWHEFFQTSLTQELLRHLDSNFTSWTRQLTTKGQEQQTESNYTGDYSRKKPSKPVEVKTTRKTKKVFGKSKCGCVSRKKTDSKSHNHQVTFALKCDESANPKVVAVSGTPPAFELTTATDHELCTISGLHTFLITTRGLRRHSLPETQGAIRKTFNFTLSSSKRNSPMLVLDTRSGKLFGPGGYNRVPNNAVNSQTAAISTPAHFRAGPKSLRTASANILQTLCEDLMHQPQQQQQQQEKEINPQKHSVSNVVNPFPLPDAWLVTDRANCQPTLAINLAATDFVTLAHRRSSMPLIEK